MARLRQQMSIEPPETPHVEDPPFYPPDIPFDDENTGLENYDDDMDEDGEVNELDFD